MDSSESADLFSFLNEITDWDTFQSTDELEVQFLKVLEDNIHPRPPRRNEEQPPPLSGPKEQPQPPIHQEEQPPLSNCKTDDKENISPAEGHFPTPPSKEKVRELSKPFVPKNTKISTDWAVKNFRDWLQHHNATSDRPCPIDLLEKGSALEMNEFLSLYVIGT